jgi:putative DNA primase/helicase
MKKPDLILSRGTPHKSAQEFRNRKHKTILKYQEDWLDYDGAAYTMIEDITIESEIQLFLQSAFIASVVDVLGKDGKPTGEVKFVYDPFNPKKNDVAEVYEALSRQFHIKKGELDPPAWLPDATPEQRKHDPKNIIAFQNCLLDITTREKLDTSPNFFTRTALAINYSAKARRPKHWFKFLKEVLVEDDVIALMQQAMGYLVSGDTSLQTILYFRGKSRGGKGNVLGVLDGLIGADNIGNPSLADLTMPSGRQDLIGKSAAFIRDLNTDSRDTVSQGATHLASISSGEPQSVFRKFKGAWNGKLKCRFVLAGISLPNFGDHATSLEPRLIVFPFPVSFAGREDYELPDRLATELPGILNWCLDGYDLLQLNGRFYEPPACVKAKHDIIHGSDPIRGLGNDRCEFDPTFSILKDDLFAESVAYCREIEARPYTKGVFCGKFMVAYPQVGEAKLGSDGSRSHVFTGVRLRAAENATTIVKVYKLDLEKIDLYGYDPHDDAAILRDENGKPVEALYTDDEGDFTV